MATAAPRTRAFYEAVLCSLAAEGFADRTILRTFLATEQEEAVEVLMLHHGNEPETAWVASDGKLIHGPIPGFGPSGTS